MSCIGIHIDNNIHNAINNAKIVKQNGGSIVQMFVNVMDNKYNSHCEKFKKYCIDNNIKCVVHASYTINCANNWTQYSWWINQFVMEIEFAHNLGAFGIIVHLGKQLNLSIEEALNNMYTSLIHINNLTQKYSTVKILIETSTGQGSEICYKLNDLAHLYRKFLIHKNPNIKNRFGLCIDTCHIFAAGYNITNKHTLEQFLDEFNELIGLNHVKLIHLNDSKTKLGSHIDRHENLGHGFIGLESLVNFTNFFIKQHIPIILETPSSNILSDLKLILSLVHLQ